MILKALSPNGNSVRTDPTATVPAGSRSRCRTTAKRKAVTSCSSLDVARRYLRVARGTYRPHWPCADRRQPGNHFKPRSFGYSARRFASVLYASLNRSIAASIWSEASAGCSISIRRISRINAICARLRARAERISWFRRLTLSNANVREEEVEPHRKISASATLMAAIRQEQVEQFVVGVFSNLSFELARWQ